MSVYRSNITEHGYWYHFYRSGDFFCSVATAERFPFEYSRESFGPHIFVGEVGETLESWAELMLKRMNLAGTLVSATSLPGNFHPRMWRGEMPNLAPDELAGSASIYSRSVVSAKLIVDRLFELFSYIEPSKTNLDAFGHKPRELLLLACMEVESSWKGVLKANQYLNSHLNTNDYVKLLGPMRLADFEVEFVMYPDLPAVTPFGSWKPSNPTTSISWYDAYNKTKHDRESNFGRATLISAIQAVSAVAVMLCAQFGPQSVPAGIRVHAQNRGADCFYLPEFVINRQANPDGSTKSLSWSPGSWRTEPLTL